MDELDEQLQQLHLINGRIQHQQEPQQQQQQQLGVVPETKNVIRLVQNIEGQHKVIPNKFKTNPTSALPITSTSAPSSSSLCSVAPMTAGKNFTNSYGDNKVQPQQQLQKKVGPLVPPKPNKKPTIQADYEKYTAPLLLRKNQYSACGMGQDSQVSSIVTLDNPLVLEQQLEALEHHKKQLERRNKLPQQQQQHQPKSGIIDGGRPLASPLCAIPKLSSTSLLSASLDGDIKHGKNDKGQYAVMDNSTYINMPSSTIRQQPVKDFNNVYSNMMSCSSKPLEYTTSSDNAHAAYLTEEKNAHNSRNNTIYTNLLYDKDNNGTGGTFTNLQVSGSKNDDDSVSCENGGTKEFFNINHEDELLPPPPSPVSSSYSELRRASEMFKVRQVINSNNNNNNNSSQIIKPNESIHTDGHGVIRYCPNNTQQQQQHSRIIGEKFPFYGDNSVYGNEYKNYNVQNNTSLNAADYYGCGGFSQSSSCYESIYEPINPRPPSQLSSNASQNFLMYADTCVSGSSGNIKSSCAIGCGSGGVGAGAGAGIGVGVTGNNMGILSKSISSNLTSLDGGGNITDCNPSNYSNSPNNQGQGTTLNYTTPSSSSKHNDVETLTNYLVQSMEGGDGNNSQDLESYGICYKCQQRVVGENSGCTAMDQIYHIACFTCVQCQINLQGKAFYALEGKPYCEYDYLQTLEKCSVCMKPILERILRATGKPYHPQCFTCVVCMKSLDGIPFTVDATNQNYCIEDFHKKFAPRCCVCKNPIMPEPGEEETVRVVALDRSFHFECYKCEDCGLLLSSEAEGRGCYPLDDHVLCKSCNAKRVQMLTSRMITEL